MRAGHPPVVAIDEAEGRAVAVGAVDASSPASRGPLGYPVAIDRSGRVADGYRVQDSPWLTLVSGSGRFLFYYDVSVKGWPTAPQLLHKVQAALARAKR